MEVTKINGSNWLMHQCSTNIDEVNLSSEVALVPQFEDQVRLYFSSDQQRWVLRAPKQLVLLDPPTLDVLLACDGQRTLADIARAIDGALISSYEPVFARVKAIILRLVQRGFLRFQSC